MIFEELNEGDSIFIDANIFIYNFGALSTECKTLLIRCAKKELIGYTLTSILAEVLHKLMIAEAIEKQLITDKNPVKNLIEKPDIIKNLVKYNKQVDKIREMNIAILNLTNELIHDSAKIRQTNGLLTNDSLVVAAMKDMGLSKLATNDNDFDKIKWLQVYKPEDV